MNIGCKKNYTAIKSATSQICKTLLEITNPQDRKYLIINLNK